MNTIIWGVLGCARIADKAVIPGIIESNNGTLYGIASSSAEKLADFSQRHNPQKTYTTYEALLDDPAIQAVYIPLPNGLHYSWTLKALAKRKHVLCEKPLGISPGQVKEMFLMAREHGVLLMEAFAYRHSPLTARVKEICASKELGQLMYIDSHFSFFLDNPHNVRLSSELAGGATFDLGCYNTSIIRHLGEEEPISVQASGTIGENSGVDEISLAIMDFPSGLQASAYASFHSPLRSEYTVVGTRGILRVPVPFNAKGQVTIMKEIDGETERITLDVPDNYTLEVEQFGRAIQGTEPVLIDENESVGNAVVIDAILAQISGSNNR